MTWSRNYLKFSLQWLFRDKSNLQVIVGARDLHDEDNVIYNVNDIIIHEYNE